MYAERKGWDLSAISVDVRYDVDEDGNATIDRTITLPTDLEVDQRERLGEIAEKTPVTLAVRQGTPISTAIASAGP
jgi:putative redox protein